MAARKAVGRLCHSPHSPTPPPQPVRLPIPQLSMCMYVRVNVYVPVIAVAHSTRAENRLHSVFAKCVATHFANRACECVTGQLAKQGASARVGVCEPE